MRDTLYTDTLARVAVPTTAIAANGATNGSTIDLEQFGNRFQSVMFVVQTGTVTDGTYAVKIQDSDDATTWTDAPTRRRQGSLPTVAGTDDNALFAFGYTGYGRRYVRLVVTAAAVTTGGSLSAVALLSDGGLSPVKRA